MGKTSVKMLAGFSSIAGLVLLLTVTFNIAQQPQPFVTQAEQASNLELLTDRSQMAMENSVVIDFSKENCCKILSLEYMQDMVIFDNESTLGWSTLQANGFVNHSTSGVVEPGAPSGISGTRMTFTEPVVKVGFMVQSGSPYNLETFRTARSITLKAYDESNNLLFFEVTDTCLKESSSCKPRFIGVGSGIKNIKFLEVISNESSNWSIDDLVFEI